MAAEKHKAHAPRSVRCGVITASNTRTPETDTAGQYLQDALRAAGHEVTFYRVVKDDEGAIGEALEEALEAAWVVLISGGTGLAPTDVTIEAVGPYLEKRMEGFGEVFRWLSFQEIGTAAILSRATAGVARGRFVACLPGAPKAVRLALEKVLLPELGHVAHQLGLGEAEGG